MKKKIITMIAVMATALGCVGVAGSPEASAAPGSHQCGTRYHIGLTVYSTNVGAGNYFWKCMYVRSASVTGWYSAGKGGSTYQEGRNVQKGGTSQVTGPGSGITWSDTFIISL